MFPDIESFLYQNFSGEVCKEFTGLQVYSQKL